MASFVVLDAGPLGLVTKPRGKPDVNRCKAWVNDLDDAGFQIIIPEIADYEVRRELIRNGATAGIARLDRYLSGFWYEAITTAAMRQAAEFWAIVRRAGAPTADPHALDADCILAAQASLLPGPGDVVIIATTNVRHLGRFPDIDAREWQKIAP
jgi:predicted nucleic acid-binding protein